MKKYAIYLPQFHEIEENNKWWGNGFTEWTNVKKAQPLFSGHRQPVHPLNDNYYNLLERETMLWQADLASKYGVDGFVFYHYYFEGRLIMNKPAELLLKNSDIPMSFFFCWANHTWVKGKGKTRTILIKQTYGDRDDWEKHFSYFLPFFRDKRYLKRNGKPMLMIYVSDYPGKEEMLEYFDLRCKQEGFNGISVVETYTGNVTSRSIKQFEKCLCKQSEIVYYREPSVATSVYYKKHFLVRLYHRILREYDFRFLSKRLAIIKGNSLYRILVRMDYPSIGNLVKSHGIYFEWDNTPRHKYKGYVITAPSKDLFDKYVEKIKNDEFVFINAWNEWAEGMMIEPTEELGTRYLEWLNQF